MWAEAEPRCRGAVEIAVEMGYDCAKNSSTQVKLGRFLAKHPVAATSKKERRLCNGTAQLINCYPDTEEVRAAIRLFFDH